MCILFLSDFYFNKGLFETKLSRYFVKIRGIVTDRNC